MAGRRASIFLVGPMGAGKTSIGRRLAAETGRAFRDSDRALSERTGVSVAEIFEREGEAGFRRRERALLEELTREPETVLATGGGAVLDAANRRCLGARGVVVYLHAAPAAQWRRLRADRTRPLLAVADPNRELERLFAERHPLYQELCDHRLDTDGLGVREACARLRRLLEPEA